MKRLSLAVCFTTVVAVSCKQEAPQSGVKEGEVDATGEPTLEGEPAGTGTGAAQADGGPKQCMEMFPPNTNIPGPAGDTENQLAPSFFENMASCSQAMPDVSTVQDGRINADGDCEYPGVGGLPFISCHYHFGVEFSRSYDSPQTAAQRPGFGEIHCIFPTANGPEVFGGYFQCSNGGQRVAEPSHAKFPNAVCSANTLKTLKTQFDNCSSKNCCEDGTLTGTAAGRGRRNALIETVNRATNGNLQNGLGIRPDFRICSQPMQLNCDELAVWTGHNANSPVFGGETDREFLPSFTEAGRQAIQAAGGGAAQAHH